MVAATEIPFSCEDLKELFTYDPTNEQFPLVRKRTGLRAGYVDNSSGYCRMKLGGVNELVHRVVFLYFNGWLPEELDHKDRNKTNNLISNINVSSRSLNNINKKVYRNNTSGYKGVGFHKQSGNWRATLHRNKQGVHIGSYETALEAHEARMAYMVDNSDKGVTATKSLK